VWSATAQGDCWHTDFRHEISPGSGCAGSSRMTGIYHQTEGSNRHYRDYHEGRGYLSQRHLDTLLIFANSITQSRRPAGRLFCLSCRAQRIDDGQAPPPGWTEECAQQRTAMAHQDGGCRSSRGNDQLGKTLLPKPVSTPVISAHQTKPRAVKATVKLITAPAPGPPKRQTGKAAKARARKGWRSRDRAQPPRRTGC